MEFLVDMVTTVPEGTTEETAMTVTSADQEINLSVWESVEALAAFVYCGAHAAVLRRRREWFDRMCPALGSGSPCRPGY